VYLANKIGNNKGQQFAVKQINKAKVNANPLLLRLFKTEVNIMKKLNHPNIIKLHDFIEQSGNYYLVLDFCDSGDMEQRIQKR
jgi:serine/threonine protein kinase